MDIAAQVGLGCRMTALKKSENSPMVKDRHAKIAAKKARK
jgi:hypothetical protein